MLRPVLVVIIALGMAWVERVPILSAVVPAGQVRAVARVRPALTARFPYMVAIDCAVGRELLDRDTRLRGRRRWPSHRAVRST